jgi:hypothetical protein
METYAGLGEECDLKGRQSGNEEKEEPGEGPEWRERGKRQWY